MDASLGLSFSQMRRNKIMARKKVPWKSYEREIQKFSTRRPFYISYNSTFRIVLVLLFMLRFRLTATLQMQYCF